MQNKTRIFNLSTGYYTGGTGLLMNLRERLCRFIYLYLDCTCNKDCDCDILRYSYTVTSKKRSDL